MTQAQQIDTREHHGAAFKEYVAFRTAGQDFCFDIMKVREIRGWTEATILPHAPSYVLGVINLRGSVVPIVDLATRLGLPTTEPHARHVIIIAMVNTQIIGLLVEAVSDILGVGDDIVQSTPDVASETTKSFISGVIPKDSKMIRLVDIEKILPAGELE
ncbi:chemotaxis protein CheW [Poseidonocella sedimentorum]|uniref:Purine-binding chemotaxis protein CheW n=1 Tax=Poseidonocella sedimentorum TaxID=871652 RepID=A0A1I6EHM2_9RHOB|nr:chemotaxis protein CheW [Poseidonocella sedimentorum]SFR17167.1 purine-binding chemotaxis protein CheW [Poseidonocella sedimentorum]